MQPAGPLNEACAAELQEGIVTYVEDCDTVKLCCQLLRMPPRAIASALYYLHAYNELKDQSWRSQVEPKAVVAACVFLSSKVEEVGVSNNHLLNVVYIACNLRDQGHPLDKHVLDLAASQTEAAPAHANPRAASTAGQADHELPHAAAAAGPSGREANVNNSIEALVRGSQVLVGKDYYTWKQRLLDAEQLLLRTLRFNLYVAQPHALLLNMASQLGASGHLLELALRVLNDAWSYTRASRCFSPQVLAVSALEAARELLRAPLPGLPTSYTRHHGDHHQHHGRDTRAGREAEQGLTPEAGSAHGKASEEAGTALALHWCELYGVTKADCVACMRVCLRATEALLA